jgi:hypothetical protein
MDTVDVNQINNPSSEGERDRMKTEAWKITPEEHKNSEYDYCIISKASDPDGRKAIDYAKEVREDLWDTHYKDLKLLNISVRIKHIIIDDSDMSKEES